MICFCIDRYDIESLPIGTKQLNQWLTKSFEDKEDLLSRLDQQQWPKIHEYLSDWLKYDYYAGSLSTALQIKLWLSWMVLNGIFIALVYSITSISHGVFYGCVFLLLVFLSTTYDMDEHLSQLIPLSQPKQKQQ